MCVSFMWYTYARTHTYYILIDIVYIYCTKTKGSRLKPHLSDPARRHPPGRDLTRTFHYLGQHCQIPYTQLRPFDTAVATAAVEIYSPGGETPP